MSFMRVPILLAAALGLSGAPSTGPAKLVPAPYDRLPEQVRASLLGVMDDMLSEVGGACDPDPAAASKEARTAKIFRVDLDGDGIDDYVLDEWSGRCFRNPTHRIHVWRGSRDGHFAYLERVDASLLTGPAGFAWVQTRCDRSARDNFLIESYQGGKLVASRCYPAEELKAQTQQRGLVDAFPQ